MVKVVVMTLGSAGDLHPFLAVARALREQGADVLLASQASHEAEVLGQGVPFAPIADADAEARTLAHPDLWHPIRGLGVLWRHLVVPSIGPSTRLLAELSQAGPLRVLASPLAIGARLAADRWPLRLTLAHTAPTSLRSIETPLFLGPYRIPDWLPKPGRRLLWQGLDAWRLEPMARPTLQAWRSAHGLAPIAGTVFGDWLHLGQRVCGLWPPEFAPPAADAPPGFWLCGFPLYESDAPGGGETPVDVAFYPGSVATPAAHAMRAAAAALTDGGLGVRLLSPDTPRAHLPSLLAATQVFVHHGGIGALAQGLRVGVHQLVMPSAYDQHQNGWRLGQLLGQRSVCSEGELQRTVRQRLQMPRPAGHPWDLSRPGRPNAAVARLVMRLMAD